ncbi:hypothetical protein BLSTO_04052 [Blastocystis sp. subtype 1]
MESLQLGENAFQFDSDYEHSLLIMDNLHSLVNITSVGEHPTAFMYPRHIILKSMPSLTTVALPENAFQYNDDLHYNNIGELATHPNIVSSSRTANVHSWDELNALDASTETIIVADGSCNNDDGATELDLSRFENLTSLIVGDNCFRYVTTMNVVEMDNLESIRIGMKSFNSYEEADYSFMVKNCSSLKELRIASGSFGNWNYTEFENLPSLEVIQIGYMHSYEGSNFDSASLELKNLPKLKTLVFGGGAFFFCSRAVFENLPELTSIQLGKYAIRMSMHQSSELIMRNLPKLASLTTEGQSGPFMYPVILTFDNMPSLTTVYLPYSFHFRNEVHINNAGALANLPTFISNPNATVHSVEELNALDSTVELIIVDNNGCNDRSFTVLNLTRFVNLRVFEVGDYSFSYVNEVHMIGLSELERVVIGDMSFTQNKSTFDSYSSGEFSLKDCEKLRELRIGDSSFTNYISCTIEDNAHLEVVEMGKLYTSSSAFFFASLEMKNLPKIKSITIDHEVFNYCPHMPELTSIRLGDGTLAFDFFMNSTELIMRNLPKLTTIVSLGKPNDYNLRSSFSSPRIVTLENMPSLTTVDLPRAFEYRNEIHINNAGVLATLPSLISNPYATVHSVEELNALNSTVETIIVDNNACNDHSFTVLNLTRFVNLKVFEVGDYSFSYVNEVHMIGLPELERVVIGENCFTKEKYRYINDDYFDEDPNRHFYLKDCDKLRELRIGSQSFMDYSVCEIESVDSLQVIEMGRLNDRSSFFHASLELKNMPKLKSLLFGRYAFHYCSRVVFENLPELTSIQLGSGAFRFNSGISSTEFIMRDLPKLTSLLTETDAYGILQYPRSVTLQNIPQLTTVTLEKNDCFYDVDSMTTDYSHTHNRIPVCLLPPPGLLTVSQFSSSRLQLTLPTTVWGVSPAPPSVSASWLPPLGPLRSSTSLPRL